MTMKKKVWIIVALLSVVSVFTACGARQTKQSIYKDILGKWQVSALRGDAVTPEKGKLEFSFDLRQGRIHGYGLCNQFSGSFVLKESGSLSVSELLSTLVGCENDFLETALFDALQEATRIEINGDNALVYGKDSDTAIMELKRR